jgi:hypothetical protein
MLFLMWLLPGITYLLSSVLRILNAWRLSSVCVDWRQAWRAFLATFGCRETPGKKIMPEHVT